MTFEASLAETTGTLQSLSDLRPLIDRVLCGQSLFGRLHEVLRRTKHDPVRLPYVRSGHTLLRN